MVLDGVELAFSGTYSTTNRVIVRTDFFVTNLVRAIFWVNDCRRAWFALLGRDELPCPSVVYLCFSVVDNNLKALWTLPVQPIFLLRASTGPGWKIEPLPCECC